MMPRRIQTTSANSNPAPRYNLALQKAGLPAVSDADLDEMLRPYFGSETELTEAKLRWARNAELSVPTGEIPMLGRKPHHGGQPTLKVVSVPRDRLSIRFFRGGFPADKGMVFFDFVDNEEQPVDMPTGYRLYQAYVDGNIELKALHDVLGMTPGMGTQCFAILEEVWCMLSRPNHEDFWFYT